MKTQPNESAYPHFNVDEDGTQFVDSNMTGLTKREVFAAMMLQGALSNNHLTSDRKSNANIIDLSVQMADALINALNKD